MPVDAGVVVQSNVPKHLKWEHRLQAGPPLLELGPGTEDVCGTPRQGRPSRLPLGGGRAQRKPPERPEGQETSRRGTQSQADGLWQQTRGEAFPGSCLSVIPKEQLYRQLLW